MRQIVFFLDFCVFLVQAFHQTPNLQRNLVFPFESVSLKTYLPDGDIDLTALSPQTFEDPLANEVRAVLERAENRKDTGFVVKDVQYINAEVDRLIGKDHLFKRSSILIKSWCYYESRILGAHHGVISTYALETMVLYIFQLFHSSLDGPLAVLYRLLDHYYKFDWDSYRISLYGPVPISYLPEIAAETPDNDGGELLPEKKFLRVCVDMLAVPSRRPNSNSKSFPQKNFNIVDPLKENNNLGKIVSKVCRSKRKEFHLKNEAEFPPLGAPVAVAGQSSTHV
ncbi:hypothetical protein ACHQM5_013404 [Ranunculus cassubicifolius]